MVSANFPRKESQQMTTRETRPGDEFVPIKWIVGMLDHSPQSANVYTPMWLVYFLLFVVAANDAGSLEASIFGLDGLQNTCDV